MNTKRLLITLLVAATTIVLNAQTPCVECDPNSSTDGNFATALGVNTHASGSASFVSGAMSNAIGAAAISLGFNNTSEGNYSTTIGSFLKTNSTATESVIIGSGPNLNYFLETNQTACLLVGFRSTKPTLFVGTSPGWHETGKVGIGNITAPLAKLHLLADEAEAAAIFIQPHSWENNESATLLLGSLGSRITATKNKGMDFYSETNYIFNSGFVGINTYNPPEYNLHVNGGTFTKTFRLYDDTRPPEEGYVLLSDDLGNAYWRDPTEFSLWSLNENGEDIYRITGNIGIGTINTYGYKLAVNGKILAEELMVKHPDNWPDYVFKKGYELKGLKELEEFITNEHHLPEIPTEQEVAENGIAVGQMNGLLLKKIEELTLYIIEQQKQMDKMENRLSELED